jgi:hypothetical protein
LATGSVSGVGSLALAALALIATGGCQNEAPLFPGYEKDIKPLMSAHCIRCHGAGGSLNADPYEVAISTGQKAAINGNFTALADQNGKHGLMFYTGTPNTQSGWDTMHTYLVQIGMPPPPSNKLDDWSTEMLLRWCSKPLP